LNIWAKVKKKVAKEEMRKSKSTESQCVPSPRDEEHLFRAGLTKSDNLALTS